MRKRALTFEQLKPEKGVPYTRQWLSQLEKDGEFPRRFRVGQRVLWLEDEIDRWLEQHAAQREQQEEVAAR
jgi:predicted DNA-binding transcriptional regulator AlpA